MSYAPSKVIISFPSNDAAVGYSARESVHNLKHITTVLQKAGAKVMIISSQPRLLSQKKRQQLLEFDRLLKQKMAGCFVEVYESLVGSNNGLAEKYDHDTVHMNDAGHKVVFDAIKSTITHGGCF
jgi:lysophospholipase L1-like esterase